MSFAAPPALLGLLLVPVLVVWHVRRERAARRRRDAYVEDALLASLAPVRARWRRQVPVVAQILALTALLIAVARPQTTRAVPVEQATIVVVTDRSGSMLASDVAPSRLVAARTAARAFVNAVPRTVRVGAIAFNQTPTVLQSPTRDHDAVRAALGTVKAAGSTATGDALASALGQIAATRRAGGTPTAPAAVVLLSDGKSVRGRDALAVAAQAARAKVPVYTVALGTAAGTITSKDASGATVQRPVPPDPTALGQIAARTHGKAFAVSDAKRLTEVYGRLGSQLATERRPQELTGTVAGGALLLLLSGVAASLRWFGRLI